MVWLVLAGYILCCMWSTHLLFREFQRREWTHINYKGRNVVYSFGVVILMHYFLYSLISFLFVQGLSIDIRFFYFISLLAVLGWVDDWKGTSDSKGFRGHFKAFYEGEVTTGFIKAVGSAILCFGLAYLYSSMMWQWFLYSLMLLAFIHMINLLDVRPGRAIKGSAFLSIILLFLMSVENVLSVYGPLFVSVLILFQYDRRQKIMLGDSGAMIIGGTLGYLFMTNIRWEIVTVYLLFLIALSILAEKVSFSKWIETHRLLRKFDQWGIIDRP